MLVDNLRFCAKGWQSPIQVAVEDIPSDPALPGLHHYLDPVYMGNVFAREMAGIQQGKCALTECRIVFLRYKPSRYCNVFYRLTLQPEDNSSARTVLIAGKVISGSLVRKVNHNIGFNHLHSPDKAILHCVQFPFDPQIPALASLTNRLTMQECLRAQFKDRSLQIPVQSGSSSWGDILSYRPERYCLLRFNITTGDKPGKAIVARLFHSASDALKAWQLLQMLSAQPDLTAQSMVARPIGFDSNTNACFQECLPGTSLNEYLQSHPDANGMHIAAMVLARIHAHPCQALANDLPPRRSIDMLNAYICLQKAVTPLMACDNSLLLHIREVLTRNLPTCSDHPVVLHGDYSTNQILTNGESAQAIDFSGVLGDHHLDLGNFLARQRLRQSESDYKLARLHFLDHYAALIPLKINQQTLAWFEAIALLKDAFIPLKKLRAGWSSTVYERIKLATAVVENK